MVQRLSSSGTATSTDLYSAFGTLLSGGVDPFGFGAQYGYYTDSETGFILCTYRYYDPNAGRWLTRDPIGYDGGINVYGYCQNCPTMWGDPSGLDPEETIVCRFLTFVGDHWRIPKGYFTKRQAVKAASKGRNLLLQGATGKERAAYGYAIAKEAYGENNVLLHGIERHDQPSSPARPHFQSRDGRIPGHIFFGFLTVAFWRQVGDWVDITPISTTRDIGVGAAHWLQPRTDQIHNSFQQRTHDRWLGGVPGEDN